MTVSCEDCGIPISSHSSHTGCERWCEDCFDRGLARDMDEHFSNYVKEEISKEKTDDC